MTVGPRRRVCGRPVALPRTLLDEPGASFVSFFHFSRRFLFFSFRKRLPTENERERDLSERIERERKWERNVTS